MKFILYINKFFILEYKIKKLFPKNKTFIIIKKTINKILKFFN